jgi:hypothetical protein
VRLLDDLQELRAFCIQVRLGILIEFRGAATGRPAGAEGFFDPGVVADVGCCSGDYVAVGVSLHAHTLCDFIIVYVFVLICLCVCCLCLHTRTNKHTNIHNIKPHTHTHTHTPGGVYFFWTGMYTF